MSTHARRIKAAVRDRLPAAWQVPAKYWHARLTGTLEPEMRLLPRLIGSGERAIDVGGNFGAYAYALLRQGVRVDVFEPHPACLRALKGWATTVSRPGGSVARSGLTIHPFALSSTAGDAVLHVPIAADGIEHDAAGSIEPGRVCDHGGRWAGDDPAEMRRAQPVAVRTLDSFGFDDAALIKIDVEGHEAAVIEGALATIAASAPALLVEIEQRHRGSPVAATFDRIAGLGYAGYFLRDGRLKAIAGFDVAVDQAGVGGAGYINNFMFLSVARLRKGDYRRLVAT